MSSKPGRPAGKPNSKQKPLIGNTEKKFEDIADPPRYQCGKCNMDSLV